MSATTLRPDSRVLTIVPDVNVLIAAQNAARVGRMATVSQRFLGHLKAGHVNGLPVQMAVSFKMIDTFRAVLRRHGVDVAAVDAVAQSLIDIMKYGPRALDPYVVFGGTPDPALRDVEDGGVLATAYAARADLLITDNLADFMTSDCESWTTSIAMTSAGARRQLSCQLHTRPDGQTLMVVHPVDFVHWIERRFDITPESLRATFGSANTP